VTVVHEPPNQTQEGRSFGVVACDELAKTPSHRPMRTAGHRGISRILPLEGPGAHRPRVDDDLALLEPVGDSGPVTVTKDVTSHVEIDCQES
jgi:hypothetical protein